MIVLSGKEASAHYKEIIKAKVEERTLEGKNQPHLAAVLVGNNGASETYVASKVKQCAEVGFKSTLIRLPETISEAELLETVHSLNNDSDINGFIVQLPLPKHINDQKIINAIDPAKDVDGFHPENFGRVALNLGGFIPATPKGILMLLEYYKIDTTGMHCVVVGRSNIVGLPMTILMQRNGNPGNCTVTITHSKTKNLEVHTRSADLLIAALGRPEFVKKEMVKPGAVVIDVGITRVPDESKASGFRVTGDVDYQDVAPIASAITPVPGGVGLMTIAALLLNTLEAAALQENA